MKGQLLSLLSLASSSHLPPQATRVLLIFGTGVGTMALMQTTYVEIYSYIFSVAKNFIIENVHTETDTFTLKFIYLIGFQVRPCDVREHRVLCVYVHCR